MVKKVLSMLLAACMLVTGIPAAAAGAAEKATCTEYSGSNRNAQDYATWADTVKSYLTVCEDGSLMRFQYAEGNDGYVAEYYDSSYQLLSTRAIPAELPLFGGFYAAKDSHFILTGQSNKKESASVECYRITKYDKDWKRLGSTGLYDCNTTIPFRAGSARMTEAGDYLLIRTCHEMYTSRDGKNHQANVTIQLNRDTMQITDSFTRVMNSSYGYVSHSFNQFIRVEDGKIVAVDHGDAYPRSVALIRYPLNVLDGSFSARGCEVTDMLEIPGEIGANYTGVSVGGFEYSGTAWLAAGNKVDFDSTDRTTRNIFVAAVAKETEEVTVNQITNYSADDVKAPTPHLVKTGADDVVILWSLSDSVYYTWLDGSGRQTGELYKLEGSLSDCVPLIYGGKIVWYTWKDSTVTFYEIDARTPSETRRIEVQSGHTWECISVKNHTATLKCTKCGKKKTVATPDSVNIWWQEQESTDGYYYSKFSNPFELGESIRYWIV
ncbi:MAG: hypothetical protein K2N94_15760, partial [Lachnospiraceae bacterium]|nr:hypothetical protein [Lachnospiraceae bacterium]